MRVIVIIPAAGLGTRMAAPGAKPATSKQFAELHGLPILLHTLRKIAAAPQVAEIYLALRASEARGFQARLDQEKLGKPLHIVEGGEHRQESVANALAAVQAAADDIVLVHDAVRPFVDQEIIHNVIEAARKYAKSTWRFALPKSPHSRRGWRGKSWASRCG